MSDKYNIKDEEEMMFKEKFWNRAIIQNIRFLKYTDPQVKKAHFIEHEKYKEGHCLNTAL